MSGIIDATNWYADHMDDRSDKAEWPPKSDHPQPSAEWLKADRLENEAWQAYQKVSDEELQSGEMKQPDYDRLEEARQKWLRAAAQKDEVDYWPKEQK